MGDTPHLAQTLWASEGRPAGRPPSPAAPGPNHTDSTAKRQPRSEGGLGPGSPRGGTSRAPRPPKVAPPQTYDSGLLKAKHHLSSYVDNKVQNTEAAGTPHPPPPPPTPAPPRDRTRPARHLPVSRRFPGDPSSTSESPQVLRDLFLGCRRVSNLGRTTDKKVLVPS